MEGGRFELLVLCPLHRDLGRSVGSLIIQGNRLEIPLSDLVKTLFMLIEIVEVVNLLIIKFFFNRDKYSKWKKKILQIEQEGLWKIDKIYLNNQFLNFYLYSFVIVVSNILMGEIAWQNLNNIFFVTKFIKMYVCDTPNHTDRSDGRHS